MAVAPRTASDPTPSRPQRQSRTGGDPPRPVRTCIGCRRRASAAELLRVVARPTDAGVAVVPDPRRRASGRGAWVHRDLDCVTLAERRRAFARALRTPGPVEIVAVTEYLRTSAAPNDPSTNDAARSAPVPRSTQHHPPQE